MIITAPCATCGAEVTRAYSTARGLKVRSMFCSSSCRSEHRPIRHGVDLEAMTCWPPPPVVAAGLCSNGRSAVCGAGHGTEAGYGDGCRCSMCRSANTAAYAEDRARRMAGDRAAWPHGTVNCYSNYGCRCDACRAAHDVACAAWRENRKRKRSIRPSARPRCAATRRARCL